MITKPGWRQVVYLVVQLGLGRKSFLLVMSAVPYMSGFIFRFAVFF